MTSAVLLLLGVTVGVAAGYSGIFRMRRPHPGWLIAALLAAWLFLIYTGTYTIKETL